MVVDMENYIRIINILWFIQDENTTAKQIEQLNKRRQEIAEIEKKEEEKKCQH